MDTKLRDKFLILWKQYFGNADLPLAFYYAEGDGGAEWAEKPKGCSTLPPVIVSQEIP